jgi:hypothetical protein
VRVTWVHPSWRDLVIDSLAADPLARRRFLSRCGVDGAALALSESGGPEGERMRPLLRDDRDWDALGDALHHLCPELDEAEAVRLLSVLEAAGRDPEVLALARLVIERLGWSGKAVSVDAICAWTPLAVRLAPPPEPPAVAMTWLELEPHDVPRTPAELERFADWVRLASILHEHDRELLKGLGFPDKYGTLLIEFADAVPADEPPLERDLRFDTLNRLALMHDSTPLPAPSFMPPMAWSPPEPVASSSEGFPVERVLRDL